MKLIFNFFALVLLYFNCLLIRSSFLNNLSRIELINQQNIPKQEQNQYEKQNEKLDEPVIKDSLKLIEQIQNQLTDSEIVNLIKEFLPKDQLTNLNLQQQDGIQSSQLTIESKIWKKLSEFSKRNYKNIDLDDNILQEGEANDQISEMIKQKISRISEEIAIKTQEEKNLTNLNTNREQRNNDDVQKQQQDKNITLLNDQKNDSQQTEQQDSIENKSKDDQNQEQTQNSQNQQQVNQSQIQNQQKNETETETETENKNENENENEINNQKEGQENNSVEQQEKMTNEIRKIQSDHNKLDKDINSNIQDLENVVNNSEQDKNSIDQSISDEVEKQSENNISKLSEFEVQLFFLKRQFNWEFLVTIPNDYISFLHDQIEQFLEFNNDQQNQYQKFYEKVLDIVQLNFPQLIPGQDEELINFIQIGLLSLNLVRDTQFSNLFSDLKKYGFQNQTNNEIQTNQPNIENRGNIRSYNSDFSDKQKNNNLEDLQQFYDSFVQLIANIILKDYQKFHLNAEQIMKSFQLEKCSQKLQEFLKNWILLVEQNQKNQLVMYDSQLFNQEKDLIKRIQICKYLFNSQQKFTQAVVQMPPNFNLGEIYFSFFEHFLSNLGQQLHQSFCKVGNITQDFFQNLINQNPNLLESNGQLYAKLMINLGFFKDQIFQKDLNFFSKILEDFDHLNNTQLSQSDDIILTYLGLQNKINHRQIKMKFLEVYDENQFRDVSSIQKQYDEFLDSTQFFMENFGISQQNNIYVLNLLQILYKFYLNLYNLLKNLKPLLHQSYKQLKDLEYIENHFYKLLKSILDGEYVNIQIDNEVNLSDYKLDNRYLISLLILAHKNTTYQVKNYQELVDDAQYEYYKDIKFQLWNIIDELIECNRIDNYEQQKDQNKKIFNVIQSLMDKIIMLLKMNQIEQIDYNLKELYNILDIIQILYNPKEYESIEINSETTNALLYLPKKKQRVKFVNQIPLKVYQQNGKGFVIQT